MNRVCYICKDIFPLTDDYWYRRPGKKHLFYSRCKRCQNDKTNKWRADRVRKLRKEVIEHYGGKCACCGETMFEFLSIDHVNNNGAHHRNVDGVKGDRILRYIRDNNYPKDFQVLCRNCNWGKFVNGGVCPHKRRAQSTAGGGKAKFANSPSLQGQAAAPTQGSPTPSVRSGGLAP